MILEGPGPWGVEDVARATGVDVRVLQRWHENGWARASATIGPREVRRYQLADVRRICAIAALKAQGIRTNFAVKWCDAQEDRFTAAVGAETKQWPKPKCHEKEGSRDISASEMS
jgi:DNA-binding transcriptional MerR regulator